jgi:hypothetical protein
LGSCIGFENLKVETAAMVAKQVNKERDVCKMEIEKVKCQE